MLWNKKEAKKKERKKPKFLTDIQTTCKNVSNLLQDVDDTLNKKHPPTPEPRCDEPLTADH
jgi:hypothetical protein